MAEWQDYHIYYGQQEDSGDCAHTVVGALKVLPALWSPHLANRRHILVYLPSSYETSETHYPVLYMHDGQNLFDKATSYAGEWRVDETMARLSQEGREAIIVGIPHLDEARLDEYSPFRDPRHGGGLGDDYIAFLVETLKPCIDETFRTQPGRASTGIMGSSMGGLISLYAFFHRPETFGFVGAMSPSLWFADGAIFDYVAAAPFVSGKIYLDAGTREMAGSNRDKRRRARSRHYYASVRRMQRLLYKKGYRPQRELLYVEEKWAHHREAAWARRLPNALRFLLAERIEDSGGEPLPPLPPA